MAYFRCGQGSGGGGGATFTIEIETDSITLYGQSITISKDGSTVGITVFDNTGHAEYVVDEPGTYRASCTYSGVTFYDEVTFNTVETATIYATPNGSTATPTDVVLTMLQCADIWDKSYTTMSQLLSDQSSLLAVISSNNAMDYMVRSHTWCTDVCGDSTAMTYIGANNYAADKLLADSGSGGWLEAISNSTYMESVLNVKIPTMTSNTTPSGVASSYTAYTGNEAWNAFSGAEKPYVAGNNSSGQWLRYQFESGSENRVSKMYLKTARIGSFTATVTLQLQGSDDGNTWEDIGSTITVPASSEAETNYLFTISDDYGYYQIAFGTPIFTNDTKYLGIRHMQLYGRKDV